MPLKRVARVNIYSIMHVFWINTHSVWKNEYPQIFLTIRYILLNLVRWLNLMCLLGYCLFSYLFWSSMRYKKSQRTHSQLSFATQDHLVDVIWYIISVINSCMCTCVYEHLCLHVYVRRIEWINVLRLK